MGDEDDRYFFYSRNPGKSIYSRAIRSFTGKKVRIVSGIVDGEEGHRFATIKDEIVLRTTPSGRYKYKATFVEDDRSIRSLVFQRYHHQTGPIDGDSFSIVGKEIENLLNFLVGIRTVELDDDGKKHVTNEQLRELLLNETEARRLFADNEELFIRVAESEELQRDLIAIGYRRKQLQRFELLLRDASYFQSERQRLGLTPEGIWQQYFEANPWIFGHGLSYQFAAALDNRNLEQVVRGFDVTGGGKRTDALMKTQARINSLCFVEIKRHDTSLLGAKTYRSDTWAPSAELTGGVAQVQATVEGAIHAIGQRLLPKVKEGDPTGEMLFNIDPRAYLVVGDLNEFVTQHGPNEAKFRSFELYRRNLRRPEIITFDELLYRAHFIVEHDVGSPELPPSPLGTDPFDAAPF